jgi:DNA mismatch repair protein MLH1
LPLIVDDYQPDVSYLPLFILRLATHTEWKFEQECFDCLALELARFYALKPCCFPEGADNTSKLEERKWMIEHAIFPSVRQRFVPPQSMAQDGTIVQVASLEKLYKVFERC